MASLIYVIPIPITGYGLFFIHLFPCTLFYLFYIMVDGGGILQIHNSGRRIKEQIKAMSPIFHVYSYRILSFHLSFSLLPLPI